MPKPLTIFIAAITYVFLVLVVISSARAEPDEYVPFDEYFETVEEREARSLTIPYCPDPESDFYRPCKEVKHEEDI